MGLVDITPGQEVVNKDFTPKPTEVARRFGANGLHSAEPAPQGGQPPVQTQPTQQNQKPADKQGQPEGQKQDPQMSARFAALAKKEKDLRAKMEQFKTAEQKLKDFESREQSYRQDPLKLLQDFGHTYQGLTERILNDGNPTPAQVAKAVSQDIQAIRNELQQKEEAQRQAEVQARTQAEQAAVASFKQEISDFVKAEPDNYELTAMYQQENLIFDTIEANYKETGQMMPLKEAADRVENYLWNEAQKFTQTKRFRAASRGRRAPTPGISHSMQPQPAAQQQTNRLLSEEERRQRTLEALAPFFKR